MITGRGVNPFDPRGFGIEGGVRVNSSVGVVDARVGGASILLTGGVWAWGGGWGLFGRGGWGMGGLGGWRGRDEGVVERVDWGEGV